MPITRASWYSQLPPFGWFDRGDKPGSNALGVPDWQQGIATPGRSDLGQWFNVTPPGEKIPYPMQKTDVGPAKWTGRSVDISAAGAHQMGYTPQNFPTDAAFKIEPRDEPRGLGSPAGMPVQAGELPDNADQTAVAEGSPQQGRKMPDSLMSMFQPTDPLGKPTGFSDAIAQRSNSLIGLGLGLLSPIQPGSGQTGFTQGLRGLMAGSSADTDQATRRAQLARQAQQDAFQRSQAAQAQSNFERQFARGDVTDAQRAMNDVLGPGPTPEQKADFMKSYYASKTDAGGWILKDIIDPNDPEGERKITVQEHNRTGQIRPPQLPGQTGTAAAAPATNWTPGASNAPVYAEGGNYSTTPTAPAAAATPPTRIPQAPLGADRKEWRKEQTKLEVQRQIAEETRKKQASMIDPVTEDIDRALKETKQYPAMIAGWFGNVMKPIPGSRAHDVGALIDTIKANASLDKLQQMRANSPTGASGLGAVTQGEHKLLQDSLGALDQSQTPDQFLRNLERVKRIRHEIIHGPGTAPPPEFDSSQPAAAKAEPPKPGFQKDGYVFKGGDPSDPSNWAPVR